MRHRPKKQIMGNAVEERPDIKINDPVGLPATLPAHPNRVQRAPPRPVPVTVRMEYRFHPLHEVVGHDGLRDPVRDRGHPEDSLPRSVPLRYRYRPHRRREVTTRAHPVPQLVEVGPQVNLERREGLLVDSRRSPVRLDPQPGLPHGLLRYGKRLQPGRGHRLIPPKRLTAVHARIARPLRSPRITRVHRYYGPIRPCASHRLLNPSQFHLLEALAVPASHLHRPRYRGDRFPSSARTPGLCSRRLHAGHHLANRQAPARLIPEQRLDPGFDVIDTLTTRHRTVRFRSPSQSTPDAITCRAFSASSAPRLFTAAPCGGLPPPPAERRRRITTPPSPVQHRNQKLHVTYVIAVSLRVLGAPSSANLTGLSQQGCFWRWSSVGFGCRESVAEGDRERVERRLPPHGPSCPPVAGGVQ